MSETPIDEMQTPLTDELYGVVIAKSGVPMANSPYHKLREHAAKMERALARRDALLKRWMEREKENGGILQIAVLEDTERELSDSASQGMKK